MAMTVSTAHVVHACSPPGRGCLESVNVFPELEARPTNSCIVVSRLGEPDLPIDSGSLDGGVGDFVYVGPDGVEVGLLPGPMRCPERELDPLSEYAVVGPTDCGLGPRREYGRFTTGVAPDETPPSAPGASSSSCTSVRCDDSACCGPYVASIVTTGWGPATDDTGVLLYDAGRGLQSQRTISYFSTISGSVMFGQVFTGSGIAYAGGFSGVRAYDIAGHESGLGPVPSGCPPPPDAALDPALDAFVPDAASTTALDAGEGDDARPTSEPSGACGCRTHRGNLGALGVAGLVVLALITRRRRR